MKYKLVLRLFFQVSAMSCGLLPLCQDAMALGQVPFVELEGTTVQPEQLKAALGTVSKVQTLISHYSVMLMLQPRQLLSRNFC